MSARGVAVARRHEREALATAISRHAPRGAVRVAEALAATALNRRRRAERLWSGVFAGEAPAFDAIFAALPEQPISARSSARADAAWRAICRRIAARALAGAAAGAGSDPAGGAHYVTPLGAPPPAEATLVTAYVGSFAFHRARR